MTFWSDHKWQSVSPEDAPVHPFESNNIETANYLLSIGNQIYVSDEANKGTIRELGEKEAFTIDPGQFAFILTQESISLPMRTIGFISIRASTKFLGIVNVSGFHVDPGYRGKLIFSVFNAGPTRVHLKQGDKIFMLWLADLDKDAKKVPKPGYDEIPASLVSRISGNFTTAYQVQEQLDKVKEDIARINDFRIRATAIATVVLAALVIVLGPTVHDNLVEWFNRPDAIDTRGEAESDNQANTSDALVTPRSDATSAPSPETVTPLQRSAP